MLKSFSVENYRNLKIENMEFRKINLLIGPNNAGKSNFVQAISLFSDLIGSTSKGSAFLEEVRKRGWVDVLCRGLEDEDLVKMKWVLDTT